MNMKSKNWFNAAGIVWPILVDAAARRITITYEEVAPLISTNPLSVRLALSPLQDFCLENHLPPLTVLVVGKTSKKPGGGFIAWDADDLPAANEAVFSFAWKGITNPYGAFDLSDTPVTLANRILTDPAAPLEVFSKVKVRSVAHAIFRIALRKAYDNKCAICRFSFGCALDAAHIVPWHKSNHSQRMDPRNGLLLCASHHRLFDAGLITLDESLNIFYYDAEMSDGLYSETDSNLTGHWHGKRAHLPADEHLHPSVEFLRQHHAMLKWEINATFNEATTKGLDKFYIW
jgi:putative restriction endonuclease